VDGGAVRLTDLPKPPTGWQPQAAEPSGFEDDLVAVLVVPALDDDSDVEGAESEDVLPDSLEGAEVVVVPDPCCEFLPEWLPALRRESSRESLR